MRVESSPIPDHPRSGRPRPRLGRGPVATAASSTSGAVPVRNVRSSGLFEVPTGDGNAIQLVIYLSSFSSAQQTARVTVKKVADGNLEPVYFQALPISAGEARRIDVYDIEGETVEVTVDADECIIPSAGVLQTFRADGATVVLVWKAPGEFVRL